MFDILNFFKNFFSSSKKECSVCGVPASSTQVLYGYDESSRGQFPDKSPLKILCTSCLRETWKKGLADFSAKAVCALPWDGYNSYSFITLDAAEEWGIEPEFSQQCETYLQTATDTCMHCSKKAHFFQFKLEDISVFENQKIVPLCSDHFVDKTIEYFEKHTCHIDEINTAYQANGIYMSGEY